MAQKVQVTMTDDLNPDVEATQTIAFSLDGTAYEIDLGDENAASMRDALALYVGAARRVQGAARRTPAAPRTGPDPKEVRAWALKQKIEVPERGRLPREVIEKYEAAKKK